MLTITPISDFRHCLQKKHLSFLFDFTFERFS
jgi:hypothetical protein